MIDLNGARILIVEDELLIGMMLQSAFEENGADVLWAQTDRGAYEILDIGGSQIDLLITDINLREGTTGFDVARHARARNDRIAVIYLSGEVASAATPFAVQDACFISKPVTQRKLIEAAARLIGPPRTINPAPAEAN